MKKDIKELPIEGKKVLVRVDFNVPLLPDRTISDDTRIRASLPTIEYILNEGGSVILMSHLGRPKGEKNPNFSLAPCAKRLGELLNTPVIMATDCVGKEVEDRANQLRPGDILLLENVRFHAAEEKPDIDPNFAKELASLGNLYVNDAFGSAHRAHSSTTVIAQYFPNKCAAGFLLQKEIDFLGTHLDAPEPPFYAIIGGAKVSSKLGVLEALLSKVDGFFIGGGMAYTFLHAKGVGIGDSLLENELLSTAREFIAKAEEKNCPIHLPIDIAISEQFSADAERKIVTPKEGIPDGWQGMDIGPATATKWQAELSDAKTVFWNGPLGVFEFPKFAEGTEKIANTLAHLKATTIVGGGDSVAAINRLGLSDKFSHISTGGGASLEYIEKGHLPGIDALV